jgi:hypothetical protein
VKVMSRWSGRAVGQSALSQRLCKWCLVRKCVLEKRTKTFVCL